MFVTSEAVALTTTILLDNGQCSDWTQRMLVITISSIDNCHLLTGLRRLHVIVLVQYLN